MEVTEKLKTYASGFGIIQSVLILRVSGANDQLETHRPFLCPLYILEILCI